MVSALLLAVASPRRGTAAELAPGIRGLSAAHALLLAERHRLAPALSVALDGAIGLNAEWAASLARTRREAKVRDLLHAAATRQVIEAFADAALPVILLKGRGLAERLYVDPAERLSEDTDLLVPRGAFGAAGRLLTAMGYRPHAPEAFVRTHFHVPYVHTAHPHHPVVELHWDVTRDGSAVRFDVDDWWRRPREATLACGRVLLPPPDDEIAYVAWHAFSRGNITLRDLHDVAALLLAEEGADSSDVARAAARAGAGRHYDQARRLAAACFDLTAIASAGDGASPTLRTRLARNILAPATVVPAGAKLWWPFRRIVVWSLAPPGRGPVALFHPPDPRPVESAPSPLIRAWRTLRRLPAMFLAIALCTLPRQVFPGAFRAGNSP